MQMRNYELFSMKISEPIQEMVTTFTIIINELKSLVKIFTSEEVASKSFENSSCFMGNEGHYYIGSQRAGQDHTN